MLYWDVFREALAIGFTVGTDQSAFPIRFLSNGSAYINATRFFNVRDLDLEQFIGRHRYEESAAETFGIEESFSTIYIIDLPYRSPLSEPGARQ